MAFYLIDYENVKAVGPIETLPATDTVIFFYTKNADTLSFDLHRALLATRARVEYISVASGGKNALDFQLSTHVGHLTARSAGEHFYIVSGDRGFEHVIAFCREQYGATVELLPVIGAKKAIKPRAVKPKAAPRKKKEPPKKQEPLLTPEEEVRAAIATAPIPWENKEGDIAKIFDILAAYEQKAEINTALAQHFKDSRLVGRITRLLRPLLKEKA